VKPAIAIATQRWWGTHRPVSEGPRTQVDVKLAKSVFRPGDEPTAELRVTGADGEQTTSALGLVVVDKAVEERERTDQDLAGKEDSTIFASPGARLPISAESVRVT